jgi:hypothetical protein
MMPVISQADGWSGLGGELWGGEENRVAQKRNWKNLGIAHFPSMSARSAGVEKVGGGRMPV